MSVLFRLLSGLGAIAHIGDVFVALFTTLKKPNANLRAGGARIAGALVIAVILAVLAGGAIINGNEGAANPNPTTYTVSELADNHDLGGKVYATITATLADDYVRVTKNGNYDHSEYIIGDQSTGKCMIVVSKLSDLDMDIRVRTDGTVTLTGMLRTDQGEIQDAIDTMGTHAIGYDLNPTVLLREGETPASPTVMYSLAGVLGVLTAILLIGWAIGYLVFRPSKGRQGLLTSGMAGPVPVHVTGLIPGYANGIRAREKNAELELPVFMGDPALAPVPPVDLLYKTRSGNQGLRLMPGTTSATLGTAYPLRGPRPAIRIRFNKYKLILSFDSEQARDQAFDQLKLSGPMTPGTDGATLTS